MLKVYGRANSINVRKVLWMLGELGLEYEREDWGRGFRPTEDPEFRKINPVGVVPVIDDGDFRLRESHTIVRYLAVQARAHRPLPQGPQDARHHRVLDGLGRNRVRQRHAAGVPRPHRQEPGVCRQGRSRHQGVERTDAGARRPSVGRRSLRDGQGLHDRRHPGRPGRQPLVLHPLPEARVQGRIGLLRQALHNAPPTERMGATAHLERSRRSRNCRILCACLQRWRKETSCVSQHLAACWLGLALGALCACSADRLVAQEYCVACTEPPGLYRCIIEGARPGGSQPLQMLCITAMAKEGHHATCGVKGGTVFDCNGPVKRVPWAAYNDPGPRTGAGESASGTAGRPRIPVSHPRRWKRWQGGQTRRRPSRQRPSKPDA